MVEIRQGTRMSPTDHPEAQHPRPSLPRPPPPRVSACPPHPLPLIPRLLDMSLPVLFLFPAAMIKNLAQSNCQLTVPGTVLHSGKVTAATAVGGVWGAVVGTGHQGSQERRTKNACLALPAPSFLSTHSWSQSRNATSHTGAHLPHLSYTIKITPLTTTSCTGQAPRLWLPRESRFCQVDSQH